MWHEGTRLLRDAGKIKMVGIVQEQHPFRTRLFMQWKQMNWPVMVDALDLLDVGVVPITLLIDERGVIRHRVRGRDAAAIVESFLEESFDPPEESPPPETTVPDLAALKRAAAGSKSAQAWRAHAEASILWGDGENLTDGIESFRRAVEVDGEDARAEFRLGVTYRMRYDTASGRSDDFTRAVEHWTRARELDPNNYIWARRLQQFGPRQQKPYPFYDWVDEARKQIVGRGEVAVELPVEPRGAELALPAIRFNTKHESGAGLDPNGLVQRDAGQFVRATATLVPQSIMPSRTARVHLDFRPSLERDAHWNNEVRGLVVWLDVPEGWEIDRHQVEVLPRSSTVSAEPRHVEYEVRSPADVSGPAKMAGYALYYVCEGIQGQCLYRRQDLTVELRMQH